MIDASAIDDLIDWMIDGARPGGLDRTLDGIGRRLTGAGLPIGRFALFISTLHPNVAGRRFLWAPETGVKMAAGGIDLYSRDEYVKNPLPVVTSKQVTIRRRLTNPNMLSDYLILGELVAEGFTDYVAQPLIFTTGETHAVTWSTKHKDGWSDEAIAVLERVRRPLARLVEAYVLRLDAASIISAYVGRNSGEQILQGRIHRGDGEEIDAAILFTDLIGFATLSSTRSGGELVTLLNAAYDVMVPPVEVHGGEILKFLGDGFFAIFPYGKGVTLAGAVKAASETVMEGEKALAESEVGKMVGFRSAIHAGRFLYGNIGGANRLDFTAIGQPVNYAARLLSAASDLDQPRVASAAALEHLCLPPRLVAEVAFKGFDGLQPVYAY
ncbi:MAG: adenylate/guanylate cyclase domain-containing protein [Mesorhizobium sp.]|nr:adenylate/guanylate cyclase domain-containing protein [Mesorhizobium sp.]MBL8577968.1 adenylate/guanylate cyclase domain-containing protein [Mesorhizobium sp.]